MSLIFDTSPQGSDEWKAARRGVITASRFKDARDKLKSGAPSGKQTAYAFDLARELCGGKPPEVFQNAAMRFGSEQEPLCRMEYEGRKGVFVDEAGFAYTEDKAFGVSVDGFVGDDGIFECKTMVSSDTLFTAVVDGDISAYMDQCIGAMWLTGRKWIDLCLWAPDLADIKRELTIIRIERNEEQIQSLEDDLAAFYKKVQELTAKLKG